MIVERFRGVLSALGREDDWYRYFNITQGGFQRSFLVALGTLPAYFLIARAVEVERGRLLGDASRDIPWGIFAGVMGGFTLAFPFVAVICATLFGVSERLRGWVIVRHWAVFFLAWFAAALFGLYIAGAINYATANLVGFAAWFGVLALDIRLAQKVGGFGLGGAVLVGSIITSLGLSLILAGLVLYLSNPPA